MSHTDDWWDTLYADDTETGHRDTWDSKTPRHDTAKPQDTTAGRTVRVTGRSGRLPDWWRGPRALDDWEQHSSTRDTAVRDSETPAQDTPQDTDETDTETPEPDETEQQDTKTSALRSWARNVRTELKTDWTNWRGKHDDTHEEDQDEDANEDEQHLPVWHPARIAQGTAGAVVNTHRKKPLHKRAATAGQAVTNAGQDVAKAVNAPRPSLGRLVYAASAIATPWWLGLTPWLTEHLDGAPLGVSIGLILIGWSIHRTGSRAVAPVAWCAHSLYVCCVISAFLHS